MTPYIVNIEGSGEACITMAVWANDIEQAVNLLIDAGEINENFTGSHGPKWSLEPIVDLGRARIVYGPEPGYGAKS